MGRSVKVQKELKKKIRTEYKRRLEEDEMIRLDQEVVYYEEPRDSTQGRKGDLNYGNF